MQQQATHIILRDCIIEVRKVPVTKEVIVEKRVEVPVDRIVEKRVEVPVVLKRIPQ
jgi:hypothetical protein